MAILERQGELYVITLPSMTPLVLTVEQFEAARKRGLAAYPPENLADRRVYHVAPAAEPYGNLADVQQRNDGSSTPEVAHMASLTLTFPGVSLVIDPPATAHVRLELGADQLSPSGALKLIDDLEIPRSAYRPTALQANGEWLSLESWHLAGCPAYQRVQLELDVRPCPRELSTEQVAMLAQAVQQMVDRVGPDPKAAQVASVWRGVNQLLAGFMPVDNVRG